jgi:hypothetical protein
MANENPMNAFKNGAIMVANSIDDARSRKRQKLHQAAMGTPHAAPRRGARAPRAWRRRPRAGAGRARATGAPAAARQGELRSL